MTERHVAPTGLPELPTAGDLSPCIATGCSACCHDTEMLLTNADVVRIATVTTEDFWFQADDGYLQLRTRDAPALPGMEGRPCTFLTDEGHCRIWEHRPEGCRLYPAIWDVDARRAVPDDDTCPYTDGFEEPALVQADVGMLAGRLEIERDARVGAKA